MRGPEDPADLMMFIVMGLFCVLLLVFTVGVVVTVVKDGFDLRAPSHQLERQ